MKQQLSKLFITIVAIFLLFAFDSYAKENATTKETQIQTNAFSYMCKDRIENLIKEMKGVSDVYLSMDDKILTVHYDENLVKPNDMIIKIKDIGYEATIINKSNMNAENKDQKNIQLN